VNETVRTGEPRGERSKQAILGATRELLAEEGGVRSLTVEAVAARSGVAKTTIYRRWHDKWEDRMARRAPLGPEVDEHRLAALLDLLIERRLIRCCDDDRDSFRLVWALLFASLVS
jgi:AcrR family transcriptional regulator